MIDVRQKKVLVIDDEPHNVEALLAFFKENNIEYDYSSSLPEAMTEYLPNSDYGAIVLDNHFSELEETVSAYGQIHGLDFANILSGRTDDKSYEHFLDKLFEDGKHDPEYKKIVDKYQNRVMLFSGSAMAESEGRAYYDGIHIVQKKPDEAGVCCEMGVVETLADKFGYRFQNDFDIKGYKTKNGLAEGCKNEDEESLDQSYQFLKACGIGTEELAEMFSCETAHC